MCAGLFLAASSVRLRSGMLYGVSPLDPLSFVIATGVGLRSAALYLRALPAHRAGRSGGGPATAVGRRIASLAYLQRIRADSVTKAVVDSDEQAGGRLDLRFRSSLAGPTQ